VDVTAVNRNQRRAGWFARYRGQPAPVPDTPAGTPSGAPLSVHINEIVLWSLPRVARHDVADAIRAELTGLIAAGGLPASWGGTGRTEALRAGPVRLARTGTGAAVGRQIAGAVYGGRGR
jgi:hypothetical protein